MHIYIVSDVHLKFHKTKDDQMREDRFISFLDNIKKDADILVLNGDIFDLWYCWKNVIIKGYFSVLMKLKELSDSGIKIYFVSGNHDFWFGDFLKHTIKAQLIMDYLELKIDEKNIFISHGDLYTTNDLRYKIFRTLIRKKVFKYIFHILHPDLALALGKTISRSSRNRKYKPKLRNTRISGLHEKAKTLFPKFDYVVMGHTHKPELINFNNGVYANSGNWLDNSSYLLINNGEASLNFFGENNV